jgi:hypothetical protein
MDLECYSGGSGENGECPHCVALFGSATDELLDEDDELVGLDLDDQLDVLWDRANESA